MSKKRRSARHPYSTLGPFSDSLASSSTQSSQSPLMTPVTPAEALEGGLREFRAKRYAQAITLWQHIDQPSDVLKAALAEAYFRIGVSLHLNSHLQSDGVLVHLQHAVELAPADPVYAYHLGLALHRRGRVAKACEQYRRAVSHGLVRKGSGVVMALAELALDPYADLLTTPGISSEDLQTLALVMAILRGEVQAVPSGVMQLLQPLTMALRGSTAVDVLEALAMLTSGDAAQARKRLMALPGKGLSQDVAVIRWHYIGVASARLGDWPAAIESWKQIKRRGQAHAAPSFGTAEQRYQHIFAAGLTKQSLTLLESGDPAAGLRLALEGVQLAPESLHLTDIVLTESDRLAHRAAASGDWAQARQYWANALSATILETTTGVTTGAFTYPVLVVRTMAHNLALACEAVGDWLAAASAWRQMLRTKPRKNSRDAKTDPLTEAHWVWVRKHVIACYKQAGDLKQAIAVCRQAIKAQPDDAELQLDLAEALLANEQMGAGTSELQKLLARHPQHVEALARLAQVYSARNEWQTAEQTLLKALQVEPNNPKVRGYMADVLMDWGNFFNDRDRYDKAGELFERALTFAPTQYALQICLARVDFNRNKPKSAREHLEQALTLGKNKGDAYVQAFGCWVTAGDLAEARAVLARAEANGQMTASVCVSAGVASLQRAAPTVRPNPLDLILNPTRKPKKIKRRARRIHGARARVV
ncbi:MAG: tetratricopeptide repeat protein [Anaerolineae bacterium]|nr:tetratricopeptide repeat protein [Anaerolineae bacterium]